MVMKLFFRNWLVLALLLVPALMSAHEVVDSVDVDPYEGMIIDANRAQMIPLISLSAYRSFTVAKGTA